MTHRLLLPGVFTHGARRTSNASVRSFKSETSISTAPSRAQSLGDTHLADIKCPEEERKPAEQTTCSTSCFRASSQKTRCATVTHRKRRRILELKRVPGPGH